MIRNAGMADVEAIARIYNHYIMTTTISFEEQPVSAREMQARIEEVTASLPWLVFRLNDEVVGYAYAGKWKGRSAYRHSVESSIYLSPGFTGRGIGRQLYAELVSLLRMRDIHSVIGGIALPNPASVALHEKLGFTKVAHFTEVGRKFDRWIDVGYWQLVFPPA